MWNTLTFACFRIHIPRVGHYDTLLMEAEGESIVEGAQVNVRLVLHHALALLGNSLSARQPLPIEQQAMYVEQQE